MRFQLLCDFLTLLDGVFDVIGTVGHLYIGWTSWLCWDWWWVAVGGVVVVDGDGGGWWWWWLVMVGVGGGGGWWWPPSPLWTWRGPYLVSRVLTLGVKGGECPVIPPVHWKGVALPRQRSSRTLKQDRVTSFFYFNSQFSHFKCCFSYFNFHLSDTEISHLQKTDYINWIKSSLSSMTSAEEGQPPSNEPKEWQGIYHP